MNQSFEYKAIDKNGEEKTSFFVGTKEDFYKYIKKQELQILSLKEKEKKLKKGKISSKDFIYFIEELSYLISSGMTLDNALKILIENSTKKLEQEFFAEILKLLQEGNQFSISMEQAASKFNIRVDSLTILLIQTNESIGDISKGLLKAKEHLEFNESILKSVKQAIAYPLFLIVMSFAMVFFVFLFIVPKFSTIFTPDEFQSLPPVSKFVLEVGIFVDNNSTIIIAGVVSFIVLVTIFKELFGEYLKALFIKIPLFKKLQINLELSYFFASLHLMLDGGIDLKTALTKSSAIISYPPLKKLILTTIEELKKGIKMSDVFYSSNLIPSNAISLIAAGESSASLSDIFSSLSKRFIESFQEDVKRYISILEPTVIVFMGIMIAFIVIAIMLAVMSITDIA